MVMFMRETGLIINLMDMEYIYIKKELDMKAFGKKTINMVQVLLNFYYYFYIFFLKFLIFIKELRHGLMVLDMKEIMKMVKSMGEESFIGLMVIYLKF